jgi:NAD(P)-dependent dehydrogenase (short-subunit alcohol dehydrogenase family)
LTQDVLCYTLNSLFYSVYEEVLMDTFMKGKTILVTGATNGIGLVAARELARMGAQVTIVSRNAEKCAAVAEEIKTATGNPVEWIAADLSTLEGVMQASMTFKKRHTHLHVLVNNAGGFFNKRLVTPDGYEMTFALNHLNYFLLTKTICRISCLRTVQARQRFVHVRACAEAGRDKRDG